MSSSSILTIECSNKFPFFPSDSGSSFSSSSSSSSSSSHSSSSSSSSSGSTSGKEQTKNPPTDAHRVVKHLQTGAVVVLYNDTTTLVFHRCLPKDDLKGKAPVLDDKPPKFRYIELNNTSDRIIQTRWPSYIIEQGFNLCRCKHKKTALDHLTVMEPTREMAYASYYASAKDIATIYTSTKDITTVQRLTIPDEPTPTSRTSGRFFG
jgi:hypothetical protein